MREIPRCSRICPLLMAQLCVCLSTCACGSSANRVPAATRPKASPNIQLLWAESKGYQEAKIESLAAGDEGVVVLRSVMSAATNAERSGNVLSVASFDKAGKQRWARDLSARGMWQHKSQLAAGGGRVVVAAIDELNQRHAVVTFTALSPSDGTPLWSRELPYQAIDAPEAVDVADFPVIDAIRILPSGRVLSLSYVVEEGWMTLPAGNTRVGAHEITDIFAVIDENGNLISTRTLEAYTNDRRCLTHRDGASVWGVRLMPRCSKGGEQSLCTELAVGNDRGEWRHVREVMDVLPYAAVDTQDRGVVLALQAYDGNDLKVSAALLDTVLARFSSAGIPEWTVRVPDAVVTGLSRHREWTIVEGVFRGNDPSAAEVFGLGPLASGSGSAFVAVLDHLGRTSTAMRTASRASLADRDSLISTGADGILYVSVAHHGPLLGGSSPQTSEPLRSTLMSLRVVQDRY